MDMLVLLVSDFSLSVAADYATVVAAIAAAAGLIFAGIQVRSSRIELEHARGVALANALLTLDALFVQFDCIQTRLHRQAYPPEEHRETDTAELTRDELVEAGRYMGLLERLKVMLDAEIVEIATIDRLYGFRIRTVTANPQTAQMLDDDSKKDDRNQGWKDLTELARALEKYRATSPLNAERSI